MSITKQGRLSSLVEFAEYVAAAIGMAIASSGFAMLGQLFGFASGEALVLAVLGASLLCALVSISIGELAFQFPSAPGVRTYFRAAFGDGPSLTLTFLVFAIVVLFAGVEALAFTSALQFVIPGVSPGWGVTAALGVATLLNLAGVDVPRRAQLWLSVALVALLVVVSVAGLLGSAPVSPAEPALPHVGSPANVLAAVGGAIFLFTGFEWVTPLGRRPSAYRAKIPWSMPVALATLAGVFGLLTAALNRCFSAQTLAASAAPHIALGRAVAGTPGVYAMVVVSALSTLTTFNAGLMGSSRLLYALSREGRFFRWGTTVWDRTGVPIGAVLFISASCWLSGVIQWVTLSAETIAQVCAALYTMLYGAFVVGARRQRKKRSLAPTLVSRVSQTLELAAGTAMVLVGVMLLVTATHVWLGLLLLIACLMAAYGASLLAQRIGRTATRAIPTEGASANPSGGQL